MLPNLFRLRGVKGAVPTIMMLALCAKGIPESRPIMLKLLFPNRDLETEEPTNSVAYAFATHLLVLYNQFPYTTTVNRSQTLRHLVMALSN